MTAVPAVGDGRSGKGARVRITALTVTYAERNDLVLETAARALAAGADTVLIVANGSDATTLEALRGGVSRIGGAISILHSGTNLGSAGGFGLGLREVLAEADTDAVWLLDDDNWAEPESLRTARAVLSEHGFSAPLAVACYRPAQEPERRVASGEHPDQVYPRPGSALYFDVRALPARFRRTRRSGGAEVAARSGTVEIPVAPYGGLLIPRPVLQVLGSPRTDFVLYGDDYEFTERIREHGGRILLALEAVVLDADHVDGDRPASPLAPEQQGLRPMEALLRTPVAFHERVFYRFRNDLYLDRARAVDLLDRAVLVLNLAVVLAAVGAFAVKDRRNRVTAGVVARAVLAGWAGRLGPVTTPPLPQRGGGGG